VFESYRAFADGEGRVELTSGPVDGPVVAFQVEAVVARWGKHATVDRPGGFVRIDSCSLDLLSDFGSELAAGSGVGGSPGSPISLRVPSRSPAEVDSVLLLNFSWAMATPAMAVVADAGWFAAAFPEASEAAVFSLGTGRRGDPLAFDAATSFPIVLSPSDEEECVDIVVRTFSSAGDAGFLPILPDPDGSCSLSSTCSAYQLVLAELWQVFAPGGVGGSPGLAGDSGVSASAYQHLVEVVSDYSSFAPEPVASPVGDYSDALEAAGIGATPYDDQPAGDLGAGSSVWQ
jgi:hypothetical protein